MKYLIFDFDGTIVDNVDFILDIVKKEMDKRGIVTHKTMEELRQQGAKKTLHELKISKIQFFRMVQEMKKGIHQGLFDCPVVTGLKSVIQELSKTSTLYILSTNKKENIKHYLKKHGLTPYFNDVVEDHSYFGKHSGLKTIISKTTDKPENHYYIGDETHDVKAAKKASMKSVAVLWGVEGEKPLRASNPDYVFSQPRKLLQLINE